MFTIITIIQYIHDSLKIIWNEFRFMENKKISENRVSIVDILSKYCKFGVVSCVENAILIMYFWNVFIWGIPLIHNSKNVKGLWLLLSHHP